MKETYTEDQENYLRRNSAPRLLNDMLVDGVEEDSLVFKNYLIKEHNQVRKNYFEGWKCWATSESLLVREDTLYGFGVYVKTMCMDELMMLHNLLNLKHALQDYFVMACVTSHLI